MVSAVFYRRLLSLSALCLLLIFGGCATVRQSVELQSEGALKGALATNINAAAARYHKQHHEWPDAVKLAKLAGIRVHNIQDGENFAVYVLDKPYHAIPADMNPERTFAFYGYYCPDDNSRYLYCRIYYDRRSPRTFTSSSSDSTCASIHGLQLDAENDLEKFFQEGSGANNENEFNEIVHKHALKISKTSPNASARQILLEFTESLLPDFYYEAVNLNEDEFRVKLEGYAYRLGECIHNQDWTQFD